jgi:hypothetical protein
MQADPLETGNHRDLPEGKPSAQFGHFNRLDTGFAMNVIGAYRELPAKPGARVEPEVLKRQRQQPRGDLLAGGDNNVVFAGIVQSAGLAGPADEAIRYSCHCRDHDRDFMTALYLATDAASGCLYSLDIGQRCAAELLNEASHIRLNADWVVAVLLNPPHTPKREFRPSG